MATDLEIRRRNIFRLVLQKNLTKVEENIENFKKAMNYIQKHNESAAVVLECTLWGENP